MIIDVHAHCNPIAFAPYLPPREGEPYPTVAGLTPPPTTDSDEDIDSRLRVMDEAGVQMQVLSHPAGPYFPSADDAVEGARRINDSFARLVRAHPDRFAAYAVLPLPHVEESIKELHRVVDELGMCGVILACSIQRTHSPVEPEFEPIYQELDRLGTALYFHPSGNGLCSPFLNDYGLTYAVGAPLEDTTIVAHLMARAIPTRYPNIKIVVAHYGGATAMLMQRMDHEAPPRVPGLAEPPSVTAKRLYYDTVGHGSTVALSAAYQAFGADHLMAGSDYPITLYFEAYRANFEFIQSAQMPAGDVDLILSGTAQRLLNL